MLHVRQQPNIVCTMRRPPPTLRPPAELTCCLSGHHRAWNAVERNTRRQQNTWGVSGKGSNCLRPPGSAAPKLLAFNCDLTYCTTRLFGRRRISIRKQYKAKRRGMRSNLQTTATRLLFLGNVETEQKLTIRNAAAAWLLSRRRER